MAWTTLKYSKGQIDRAGKDLVSGDLFRYVACLEVVNNWRSTHNYPLNILQDGLRKRARLIDSNCIIAQRTKRLNSISEKLKRFPTMRLSMMQDIGGCRAVLSSIDEVNLLVESYDRSSIRHKLHQKDDYIEKPQKTGYRGVHLIYRYFSDKKETYNNLKIEVQIRTTLQHAWATAVETVGTFIGQALKSSQGHSEWLRFFELMGTAIAIREGCNPVRNTPCDFEQLQKQLRHYYLSLEVESHLEAYGHAVKAIEESQTSDEYFLLTLDPDARHVTIKGYNSHALEQASIDYVNTEASIAGTNKDAVLVSVESIYSLRRAYPNYFLDTKVFLDAVKQAVMS